MSVNLVCGELLDQTLGLVQGQELRYTNTHECGLFLVKKGEFPGLCQMRPYATNYEWATNWIFELAVDFRNHLAHGFQFGEHVFRAIRLPSHQAGHLRIDD